MPVCTVCVVWGLLCVVCVMCASVCGVGVVVSGEGVYGVCGV